VTLKRELGLVPLAAIVFFNVSGGPYGIEDMVPAFGPGLSLLLLVLTPLVWSLPVALVMSELAAAMPDEGGYVTWTRRAFGDFWAFQVGWWSWIDSFVDVAVYPALFVEYLRFWYPAMTALERWLFAVSFVAILAGLNLIGIRPTGRAAVLLAAGTLAPIAALVIAGAKGGPQTPWQPLVPPEHSVVATLGVGVAVAMWNYSGWDTPSTTLGETRSPVTAYRRALFIALPVISLAYLLPVTVGLASGAVAWNEWKAGTLSEVARVVGGPWLGHAVTAGGMLAVSGQFLALVLTNSRLPYVLAQQGSMPAWLGGVHARFGTPWPAILVSGAFYAVLAAFSFKELVVLTIWLYSIGLVVELAAFLQLRRVEPALARPWRVPGGWAGAVIACALPTACSVLALATADWLNTVAGIVAALTGVVAFRWCRTRAT
jgi:amino acid transporter